MNNKTFYYITVAPGYPTTYDYAEYAFEHIDVKCNERNLSSWDCDNAENFLMAVL